MHERMHVRPRAVGGKVEVPFARRFPLPLRSLPPGPTATISSGSSTSYASPVGVINMPSSKRHETFPDRFGERKTRAAHRKRRLDHGLAELASSRDVLAMVSRPLG